MLEIAELFTDVDFEVPENDLEDQRFIKDLVACTDFKIEEAQWFSYNWKHVNKQVMSCFNSLRTNKIDPDIIPIALNASRYIEAFDEKGQVRMFIFCVAVLGKHESTRHFINEALSQVIGGKTSCTASSSLVDMILTKSEDHLKHVYLPAV